MRWLAFKHELFEGQLPCPAIELLQLACQIAPAELEHPSCSADGFAKAMRANPTILLLALTHFQNEMGVPPSSAGELIEFSQRRLPKLISESSVDEMVSKELVVDQDKFSRTLQKYLDARGNQKLKKALRGWIKIFTSCNRAQAQQIANDLVGESMRADQFLVENSVDDPIEVLASWPTDIELPLNIGPLFQAHALNQQMREEFEVRVRDSKLAAMKGLAYGASHEINNPLANVSTRAQTMLAVETNPDKRHKLAVIYEQAMRAHEMISDMMLFANPPRTEFSVHDLKDLTRTVVTELKTELECHHIDILVRQYPDVVPVEIDPTQYSMAIKAIVKNSVEAIGMGDQESGEIRIRLYRFNKKTIGISILDDGPGVAAETAPFMFDPFFSGREAGRGLGFGLSKAWRVMKLHQGNVFYDSRYTEGTKIEIQIPIRQKAPRMLRVLSPNEKVA